MNKSIIALMGFGAGMAASALNQKDWFDSRRMRKMQKRIVRYFR